jgi:NAD(P)H-flavin reductase
VLVPSCGGGGGSIGDSGGSIDVKQGRPNLSEAVKTAACREGWTAVIVCGPPSMTLAVRNRVHLLQLESGNKVHLHEETFEL